MGWEENSFWIHSRPLDNALQGEGTPSPQGYVKHNAVSNVQTTKSVILSE